MGRRVLYLEDDLTTRTAMVFVLSHEGYEVAAYGSAEEAAECFCRGEIDVAVLDVRLPGKRGDLFGHELHARYPDVPIVFLTAELETEEVQRLVPSARVLRKPIEVVELLKVLKALETR